MARVKRGVASRKKKKKLLKRAKGFLHGRKSKIKRAREALLKAGQHAYRDRRRKKRDFRQLWQVQINAAVREHDLSYSKFINGLKKAKIELDRKVLAQIAQEEPKTFAAIVAKAKEKLK